MGVGVVIISKRASIVLVLLAVGMVLGVSFLFSFQPLVSTEGGGEKHSISSIHSFSDIGTYLTAEKLSKDNYASLVEHDKKRQVLIIDFKKPLDYDVLDDFEYRMDDVFGNTSGYRLYYTYNATGEYFNRETEKVEVYYYETEKEVSLEEARDIIRKSEFSKEEDYSFRFRVEPVFDLCQKTKGVVSSACYFLTDAIPKLNSYWFSEWAYLEQNGSSFQGLYDGMAFDGSNITLEANKAHIWADSTQIGNFRFEDNVLDSSGQGYGFTEVGGSINYATGEVGEGQESVADVWLNMTSGDDAFFNWGNGTIMYWFNGSLIAGPASIFIGDYSEPRHLIFTGHGSANRYDFRMYVAGTIHQVWSTTVLWPKWTHITIVWGSQTDSAKAGGGGMEIYVNGIKEMNNSFSGAWLFRQTEFCVSCWDGAYSDNKMDIDELLLFNRSLSAVEIKQLYDYGRGNQTDGNFTSDAICNSSLFEPLEWFNFTHAFVKTADQNITYRMRFSMDNLTFGDFGANLTLSETYLNGTASCMQYGVWGYTDDINVTPFFTNVNGLYVASEVPNITAVYYPDSVISESFPSYTLINWSAGDEAGISMSWLEYDGANHSSSLSNGYFYLTLGLNNSGANDIVLYANDTFNKLNSTSFSIFFYYPNVTIVEGKQSIGEFDTNVLTLNVNLSDINVTIAELIWNGTSYGQGTRTKIGTDSYRFINTFSVPPNTGNVTGKNVVYYWNWSILGIGNGSISDNQTVYEVGLDDCTDYSQVVFNYTLYDEDNKSWLNNSGVRIEADILITSIYNSSLTWNYSTVKKSNNLLICTYPSILNYSSAYNLDSTARYYSGGYEVEYHYLENFNMTNTTIPEYVWLYNLLTSRSTTFHTTFKDSEYRLVDGAVIDMLRYYVEDGVYRSVEHGRTNEQGETRFHLVEEDVQYKFLVRQDGVLLWESDEYLAICQAVPCLINLQQTVVVISPSNFTDFEGVNYVTNYSEERRDIVLDFTVQDGSSEVITMNVTRLDAYANDTLCALSATGASGSFNCTIPTTKANATYLMEVWQDGKFATYRLYSVGEEKVSDVFGDTGFIMAWLLVLVLALMSVTSGVMLVIFTIMGVIFAVLLNLLEGGSILGIGSSIVWLIVAGAVLLYKIAKRRIA